MGLPIALNLIRGGVTTSVWNRSHGPVQIATASGARPTSTPAELSRTCPVILAVLPDMPQLREVLDGPNGLRQGFRSGSVLVVMSTVAPGAARDLGRELAESGVAVVDAPMSGGDVGARDGTLSIMVGGDQSIVDGLRPILHLLGSTVTYMGELGSGQLAKACNQIVVAATLSAIGEALVLARRGGLDAESLLNALGAGLAGSKALDVKREMWLSANFTPGGRAELQLKDLAIALSAGREYRTALPLTGVVEQLYAALCFEGYGDEDHAAVIRVLERLSDAEPH
jgi:2-hydroxy-3-oxopropionate reductase